MRFVHFRSILRSCTGSSCVYCCNDGQVACNFVQKLRTNIRTNPRQEVKERLAIIDSRVSVLLVRETAKMKDRLKIRYVSGTHKRDMESYVHCIERLVSATYCTEWAREYHNVCSHQLSAKAAVSSAANSTFTTRFLR